MIPCLEDPSFHQKTWTQLTFKKVVESWAVVAHVFNPSTREAEAGGS